MQRALNFCNEPELSIDAIIGVDFMRTMKILFIFGTISFLSAFVASGKSRMGSYFLGFGYGMAESSSDDSEGDFFRLTAQAPNDSQSDIGIYICLRDGNLGLFGPVG